MIEYLVGFHAIEERIKADSDGVVLLYAGMSRRSHQMRDLAQSKGIKVVELPEEELDKLTQGADHRGVALEVPVQSLSKEVPFEAFLKKMDQETALVVILDGVTDPQNYGAILRSADKFAVDLVITPIRRSVKETAAVASASAGAINWVPHTSVTNLNRALEALKEKGFWIYGADMGGQPLESTNLTGRVALVLGSEGSGLSRLVKENCDFVVSISTLGHVDSLNVSVAAGILFYEIRRQQDFFSHR